MATAKPIKKAWESLIGADGKPLDQFSVKSDRSKEAFDQLSSNALRGEGVESQWAKLQKAGLASDTSAQKEQVAQAQMAAQAQQEAKMAMRGGGLSSGASERMSSEGANQAARAQQGVNAQAARAQMGVDVQDESNRLNALRSLPGAEQQSQWGDLMNRDFSIKETGAKRAYDENEFKSKMKAWTADREAQATEKANEGK